KNRIRNRREKEKKVGGTNMTAESGSSNFDLPEDVVQVLPSDPFEQLDVARKITSIALSTRVNALEFELSELRVKIAEKDSLIAELQSQAESLDASLSETADKLVRAEQDKVPTNPNRVQFNPFCFVFIYLFVYLFSVVELDTLGEFA
ncbi:hypothetical protein KIW84_041065, partial [Lathyrus oleraceus]